MIILNGSYDAVRQALSQVVGERANSGEKVRTEIVFPAGKNRFVQKGNDTSPNKHIRLTILSSFLLYYSKQIFPKRKHKEVHVKIYTQKYKKHPF